MCEYCKNLKQKGQPITLNFKSLDMGILGEGNLWLSMERDVETEEYCLVSEFDPPRMGNYHHADFVIRYCPYCGEPLKEE